MGEKFKVRVSLFIDSFQIHFEMFLSIKFVKKITDSWIVFHTFSLHKLLYSYHTYTKSHVLYGFRKEMFLYKQINDQKHYWSPISSSLNWIDQTYWKSDFGPFLQVSLGIYWAIIWRLFQFWAYILKSGCKNVNSNCFEK